MIIDITKVEGGTPEGFEELDFLNCWLNKTQLKAKAFVINSDVNKNILLSRNSSLSLQNVKFFRIIMKLMCGLRNSISYYFR